MLRIYLLIVAAVFAGITSGADSNLLTNPGFEGNAGGWQFDKAVGRIVREARTGARALRLDCPADRRSVSASQTIVCEPGKRYLLSAWSKSDGRISLLAWFKDADGKNVPGRRAYSAGDGPWAMHDWSRSAMIIEPPAACARLKIDLRLELGNYQAIALGRARHAIFDDVELSITEQTDNLLFNGGMERCSLRDVPDGWFRALRGGKRPPSDMAPGRWVVDREHPWEGECCLRSDLPNSDMRSIFAPCMPGRTHTFSVYLRADRPMRVAAYVWFGEFPITHWQVGTEWKRYAFAVQIHESASRARVSVIHPAVEGTLWADAAQLEVGDAATRFRSSLRDLPRARLTEAAQVNVQIPAEAVELLRRPVPPPPRRPGVCVDPARECLSIDGRPFFGVGFGGVPVEHFGELEGMNSSIVMPRGIFGPGAEKLDAAKSLECARACLDRAHKLGLKVIIWMHLLGDREYKRWHEDEKRRAWLDRVIRGLKDHPAMLAWKTCDEPHTVPAEWIERLYSFFHERDPGHPAFINLGAGRTTAGCIQKYGPFTDLVSVDYYPAACAPTLEGIADFADLLRNARPGRPLHYWIQCFMGISWLRCPTPDEETAMAYLSVIHGASLISYFIYRPPSQILWDHSRDLNAELRSLARDYGLLEPPAACKATVVEAEGIHALLKGSADRAMLVTVNALPRPARVHFTIPGLRAGSRVRVAFENRTIKSGPRGFEDLYRPHARHVYLIEGM